MLTVLIVLSLLPQVLRVIAGPEDRAAVSLPSPHERQLASALRGQLLQREPFAFVRCAIEVGEGTEGRAQEAGSPGAYKGSPDDVGAINAWLSRAAAASGGAGRTFELARSRHDRPVLGLMIQTPGTHAALRLAVIARQHGDEPATTMALLNLAHRLLLRPTLHSRRALSRVALVIVPVANPDGATRRLRSTSAVVDLNRDWDRPSARETRALSRWLAAWSPQALVDVHQWVPGDPFAGSMALAPKEKGSVRLAEAMRAACLSASLVLDRETWGRWSGGMLTKELGPGRRRVLLELPAASTSAATSARIGTLALLGALRSLSDDAAQDAGEPELRELPPGLPKPGWYREFVRRRAHLDVPALDSALSGLQQPGSPWDELLQARVHLEALDCQKAWDCARRAAAVDECRAEAAYLQGMALCLREDWHRAADLFALCSTASPAYEGARVHKSRCLARSAELDIHRSLHRSVNDEPLFLRPTP